MTKIFFNNKEVKEMKFHANEYMGEWWIDFETASDPIQKERLYIKREKGKADI